jgi:hypothetical protein
LNRSITKGEGISNANILDAIYFDGALRLILKEKNNIYLTSFDTAFSDNKLLLESIQYVNSIS